MTAEDRLQVQVAKLLNYLQYSWQFIWWHVPNEGGLRLPPAICGKRKAMGVKAGCPDIHIDTEGGRTIKIELKTAKGRLSPKQKEWQDTCKRLGIPYYVCRSVDDVVDVLEQELGRSLQNVA